METGHLVRSADDKFRFVHCVEGAVRIGAEGAVGEESATRATEAENISLVRRKAFDEDIFKDITQCKDAFELVVCIYDHKTMDTRLADGVED